MTDNTSPADVLNQIMGETWTFRQDKESGGMYAVDQGGFLLTRGGLVNIFNEVSKFLDYYGSAVEEHNEEKLNAFLNHERPAVTEQPKLSRPSKSRQGWVYLIDSGEGLCKIGMTTREPSSRLAEFVPKLPFEAYLICAVQSNDALGLEAFIHERFADKRMRGEWFKLTPEDIEWFKAGAG